MLTRRIALQAIGELLIVNTANCLESEITSEVAEIPALGDAGE